MGQCEADLLEQILRRDDAAGSATTLRRDQYEPAARQHVRAYQPLEINGRAWRAISWTTAASAAAVIELVADGRLPGAGFIRQEDIPFDEVLSTKHGALFGTLGKAKPRH